MNFSYIITTSDQQTGSAKMSTINHLANEHEFFKNHSDDDLLVYLNDYHKDVTGFRMGYNELRAMRGNRAKIMLQIESLEKYNTRN